MNCSNCPWVNGETCRVCKAEERERSIQPIYPETEVEVTEQEKELANLQDLISGNQSLHSFVMLKGKHFKHYLLPEDVAGIESQVANEPEIKCRWN